MLAKRRIVKGGVYRSFRNGCWQVREVLWIQPTGGGLTPTFVHFRDLAEDLRPVKGWRGKYVALTTFANWAEERVR